MSAGNFIRTRYAASYGAGTAIHPIRVQPETLTATVGAVANDAPAGAINNPISAQSNKGKREMGLGARQVVLQAPAEGSQPAGYRALGYIPLPALTEAFYDACVPGATVSYLGADFEVVSQSPESVK